MFNLILIAALTAMPAQLDLPPEGVVVPATAEAPAVRLDPPSTTTAVTPATTEMTDCQEMATHRAAAGLPARFDAIGWRESNCRNEASVRTSCCVGYWQLNVALHLRDGRLTARYHACGVYSQYDADGVGDEARQACAAKALYDLVGYSAWATS